MIQTESADNRSSEKSGWHFSPWWIFLLGTVFPFYLTIAAKGFKESDPFDAVYGVLGGLLVFNLVRWRIRLNGDRTDEKSAKDSA